MTRLDIGEKVWESEEALGEEDGREESKCSDRSIEVKFPALLRKYDKTTDRRRTDGLIGKFHFHQCIEREVERWARFWRGGA